MVKNTCCWIYDEIPTNPVMFRLFEFSPLATRRGTKIMHHAHCRDFCAPANFILCRESPSPVQCSRESNTHPHLKSIFLIFIKLTHVIERIFRQFIYFCCDITDRHFEAASPALLSDSLVTPSLSIFRMNYYASDLSCIL